MSGHEKTGEMFADLSENDQGDQLRDVWSRLVAWEYGAQIGLKGDDLQSFVQDNWNAMSPEDGDEMIMALLEIAATVANAQSAEDIGVSVHRMARRQSAALMPFNDAHEALMLHWNKIFQGRESASDMADFLSARTDGEMLIFWNAPLTRWGMGEDDYFLIGPWTVRGTNLFTLACVFNQDDLMDAIVKFFTPHMAMRVETNQPNGIADFMSCMVLENAIWATVAFNDDGKGLVERRRRIIETLIEHGAQINPVKLPRTGYFPSDGNSVMAAELSGNSEAADVIQCMTAKAG